MITFLIIIALIILAELIRRKTDDDYSITSEIAVYSRFILLIILLFHSTEFFVKGYRYKEFYADYVAVEQTLETTRKNNNPIELTAITRDIIEINKHLSVKKMQRKSFFLKQYVDKRFDDLQFLK